MTVLRQMRRNAIAVVILVATAAGVATWMWLPVRSDRVRAIPTGASFNLTVTRLRDARSADVMAARLASAGWPAFTRPLQGGARHEVLVGPYVAIDEVEGARKRLRAGGYRATMIVDESVRRVPQVVSASFVHVGPAIEGAHLVLVGAAGRFSLVLEMPEEPRQVLTPRSGGSLVEVLAGPLTAPVSARLWDGPEGLDLVNQIAVDTLERAGERLIRTRVALANAVRSNVRVMGRRVYIDFWMPAAANAGRALTARRNEEKVTSAIPKDRYRDRIQPVIARFDAIAPFLLSAVAEPSPDVLAALAGTLEELDAWVRSIEAPAEHAAVHASLASAVSEARGSVQAGFSGNRAAQARGAYARWSAARSTDSAQASAR